jgi:hypothetical protein
MHTPSIWLFAKTLARARRLAVPTILSGLVVLVVGLPAGAAQAGPTPKLTTPELTTPEVSGLPTNEVQELLGGIPLNDLSAAQLGEVLSKLPGLGALPAGQLRTALTGTIESLAGKGDTLGQLNNPTELVSKLESVLTTLLSPQDLLNLLNNGKSLGTVLTGGLGSPEPSQLLDGLLSASSTPKQLIEQVLADVNGGKLEALLGTTLAGAPVNETTVGELAGKLGTTSEGLASSLNSTASEFPASALALTTSLTDGKDLGVLDGLKELSLATVAEPKEGAAGGGGGSGASGGSGSSGGAGGAGGPGGGTNGTPSSMTLILDELRSQNAGSTTAAVKPASGKVRIIARKVRHNTVTVTVRVPGAGRLTLTGHGVRSVSKQTSTAEQVTLRTVLTTAAVASEHAHRHGIKVKLTAAFKPVDGSSSASATTAVFG